MTRPDPISPPPALGATPSLQDFFLGFSLPWRSLGHIRRHATLRWLSLAMAVITAIILVGMAVVLLRWTDDLVGRWIPQPDSGWLLPLWWVGVVAVGLLAYVLGALTLPPIALSPLQDPMGEALEALHGRPSQPFSVRDLLEGTWVGLKHTLLRLAITLGGLVLLLPLNFVPGLGSLVFGTLATVWSMFTLAAEHVGAPLARHRYPSRLVFQLVRQRTALFLGLGAAIWLLLVIPVVNAFFLPLVVIAGAEAFLSLERAGALPPKPPRTAGEG